MNTFSTRVRNHCRRLRSRIAGRHVVDLRPIRPVVSFTFDDFPHSAWAAGGAILAHHGATGTYYGALGLLDQDSSGGRLFSAQDLRELLAAGHEFGCHTFTHADAWSTPADVFAQSLQANREALARLAPGAVLQTHAYPISGPNPAVKRVVSRLFHCARGGGQTVNRGPTDGNSLNAFFLEQARGDLDAVRALITQNAREAGWLIFATHDVRAAPSPYGCTPEFLAAVVQAAAQSGAHLLPVVAVWEQLVATGMTRAS